MEKQIIYNAAKSLLEIGQNLEPIDRRLSEMALFLSDRVLSIGEERGYNVDPSTKIQDNQEDSNTPEVLLNQVPLNCVGHSNDMQTIAESKDVQSEVRNLVDRIRLESSNDR